MSAHQFIIGDTWIIEGTLNDDDGDPLPTTGTLVECVIATTPPIVLTNAPGGGIAWTNESNAAVQILVTPADQVLVAEVPDPPTPAVVVREGVYGFQVRATLATGIKTTQEGGTITALESLL